MERTDRLRMISKICYYLGWVAALSALLGHLTKLDQALANAAGISGRNLLEASFLLLVLSMASELRAMGAGSRPAS